MPSQALLILRALSGPLAYSLSKLSNVHSTCNPATG